jgi:amino acid permease
MFRKAIGNRQQAISSNMLRTIFLLLASCFFSLSTNAQCAMCRAALEGEGNVKKAQAVNDGIVYLMLIPYILVGAIGFFIYRMYRKKKAQ